MLHDPIFSLISAIRLTAAPLKRPVVSPNWAAADHFRDQTNRGPIEAMDCGRGESPFEQGRSICRWPRCGGAWSYWRGGSRRTVVIILFPVGAASAVSASLLTAKNLY